MYDAVQTFNTFTVVGRCERTGMLGVAITSHAFAVGARCPFVEARIGAVATQATTDPRLGGLALKLLALGYSANKVIDEIAASDRFPERHQVGIVDRDGNSAAVTGSGTMAWTGHITGKNFVSMGNNLIGAPTIEAMARSFEAHAADDLDLRLLHALEAGRDAGGQNGGQRSAALVVAKHVVAPGPDRRPPPHDEPIGELARVFELFQPFKNHYAQRVAKPDPPEPA
jgi:uncharacterized Ntn-hydrolase superfamily protein